MELPFPTFLLNTNIKVYQSGVNSDGEYKESLIYEGKCIYDDKAKQVMTAEKQLVTLSGKVIIKGDILLDQKIEGYVIMNDEKKVIYNYQRPKNPNGSTFSTELNLA